MLLSFENLVVKYGDKTIVDNVNINVLRGEIVTIVGKNGSGKSTILKTLTNGVKKESGNIYLDGKNIKSYSRKEVARKMAILPQIYDSPADIDVETLVSYGRYPYKKFGKSYSKEDEAIINATLEMTKLEGLRYQRMSTLSGGERQRARIAMAICQQPEILVLDEPTTYLDIAYQLEVLELISKINREMNISILMVLHDLNLASKYSDRICVLDNKCLCQEGDPELVICKETLNNVFGVEVEIWENNSSGKPFFMPVAVIEEENINIS